MEIQVRFTADIIRSESIYEGSIHVPDNFRELGVDTQQYYIRSNWKEWVAEIAYGDYAEIEPEED